MPESEAHAAGTGLIAIDPWLASHADKLRDRWARYQHMLERIDRDGGLLGPISKGHEIFGLNRGEHEGRQGVWYREWAPGANGLSLIGDFNGWDRNADPLQRGDWGVWYRFFPDAEYGDRLVHGSRVKVHVRTPSGDSDRIPAYIRRVFQEPGGGDVSGQYWCPREPFTWRHQQPNGGNRQSAIGNREPETRNQEPTRPPTPGLRIYEAHVGMALEEGRVGTYREFREQILGRIAGQGYNAIQLMAIMEHPYYGSFGYHVSNFFAASSRFGTPEELKELIDAAHGMGLRVIIDLVHSHSVKNMLEGLNRFDGTDFQYFHAGARGEHVAWDSLTFDYARYEVLRFLLSNVRFWLDEYRFDGFRFDGVTSMLYLDHGLARDFTSYDDYFSDNVDEDAIVYLKLANETAHAATPGCITIAEDMSGMAGLARPVSEGGLGFDYRLAMGVPDQWIKLVKEMPDEAWSLAGIYTTLLNRRHGEKHVGYAESHDQALVGDQTLAFRLMGDKMYTSMSRHTEDLIVDRGVALHKLIRLLTFSLGGEGYLNFMGNEFGHPEWIDFPREGNGYSYHYARRQWSLADNPDLRYGQLAAFDRAMLQLDDEFGLLEDPFIEQIAVHEDTRQLIYRRGPLVFAFNFHPSESYSGLRIPVPDAADYRVVLDSDAEPFGGHQRVAPNATYPCQAVPMYGRAQSIQIYLPSRSAQVLAPARSIA